jgi:hypothetical protein
VVVSSGLIVYTKKHLKNKNIVILGTIFEVSNIFGACIGPLIKMGVNPKHTNTSRSHST